MTTTIKFTFVCETEEVKGKLFVCFRHTQTTLTYMFDYTIYGKNNSITFIEEIDKKILEEATEMLVYLNGKRIINVDLKGSPVCSSYLFKLN